MKVEKVGGRGNHEGEGSPVNVKTHWGQNDEEGRNTM